MIGRRDIVERCFEARVPRSESLLTLGTERRSETLSAERANVPLIPALRLPREAGTPCCSPVSPISPRVVDISLPRFSITGTYDLKRTLSYLGITKIFEEHGDLTRISPHRSLKVGEVSGPGLDATPSHGEPSHSPGPKPLSQHLYEPGLIPPVRPGASPALSLTSHVILGGPHNFPMPHVSGLWSWKYQAPDAILEVDSVQRTTAQGLEH